MKIELENRILLELLRSFMDGEVLDLTEKNISWERIYQFSLIHNVLPMTYESAYQISEFGKAPENLRATWKRQTIATVMNQMQRTSRFLEIYRKINQAGLEVLVVKGIICRLLYEKPDHRTSNDEDLFVRRQDFQRCHQIFLEEGLVAEQGTDLEQKDVVSYHDPGSGLHIELHQQLFSEESAAYGNFNAMFKQSMEKHIVQMVDNVPVMTMNYTDHMLFLICHSFKHFLHSGFGIRQICDMVMFANKYGENIEWHYIMKQLRQIQGDVFWVNLVDIGVRYLGFSREKAHFYPETYGIQMDSEALLEDIFEAGVFGKSSENRLHSSNITLGAYADSGNSTGSTLLKTLFPKRKYLTGRYPILQKIPVLLPVMWLHRLLSYGMKLLPGKRKTVSAAESLDIGNKRIELMKKYRIIR